MISVAKEPHVLVGNGERVAVVVSRCSLPNPVEDWSPSLSVAWHEVQPTAGTGAMPVLECTK